MLPYLREFVNIYKCSADSMLCKRNTYTKKSALWWDYDCTLAKRTTQQALFQFRVTGLTEHLQHYKSLRNQYRRLCRLKMNKLKAKRRSELLASRFDPKASGHFFAPSMCEETDPFQFHLQLYISTLSLCLTWTQHVS